MTCPQSVRNLSAICPHPMQTERGTKAPYRREEKRREEASSSEGKFPTRKTPSYEHARDAHGQAQ